MDTGLMSLKILLPFCIFTEIKGVKRIVIETDSGSYGFLPQRLDCVAALVPGIFTYETDLDGIQYVAVDEGIMIKSGLEVLVSVRNAIEGADLGKLHESVEKEFKNLNEQEKNMRTVLAKLESSFIHNIEKLSRV